MDYRGLDTDPGWVNRKLRELQRQIEALRSERRAAATTIGTGDLRIANGGSLVVDGGDVLLLDADGSVILRIGPQVHGDRGVSIFREDGSLAFAVRKAFASDTAQRTELRDQDGYLILAEEALGSGVARPLLHIPMQPVQATAATLQAGPHGWQVPVTAATWTTTHQAWYARHNQYGVFKLQIAASDTTTAAEVRVIDVATSGALGAFLSGAWTGTRAAGSTGYVSVESPPIFLPGNPDARISIAMQVQRTAGAGTLQVALPESHGA